jgi:lipopolysaccharide export LptBFGC system permease protein LptF
LAFVVALAALFLALLAGAALETGLPRSRGRKNAMWNKNISDKPKYRINQTRRLGGGSNEDSL